MNSLAILVPAYDPTDYLVDLVENLNQNFIIIVVNDGSHNDTIFKIIEKKNNVHIRHHAQNQGKGNALKTGLKYIYENIPCKGVITVDADGQHQIEDVLKISRALEQNPNAIILGSRSFEKDKMTLRSYIGNTLTQKLFQKIFKSKISDTQTGLRGYPFSKIKEILKIPYSGYEFEFSILTSSALKKDLMINIPIKTIYIDNNSSSHFKPFIDSVKIYFVLFRYLFIGGICFLVDNFLFFILSFYIN